MKEEEEYEYSLCAADAIQLYWPPSISVEHPSFEKAMVELQINLIKCKLPIMFPSDKKRALSTIVFLKNVLRGTEKYGH